MINRFPCLSTVAVGALMGAFAIGPARPVIARQSGEDVTFIGVIKGADVYVRSGAAETYYPFGKVNDGDLVKVTGERYDWYRIVTAGPAFHEMFGLVKFAKGDSSRVRLSADGATGVTLGKVDVVAPNLSAKNSPKDSWKPIAQLDADQTLKIVGTIDSDKDTILKVMLPENAQGWISKAFIEHASDEQTTRFKDMLANKTTGVGNAPAEHPRTSTVKPKPAATTPPAAHDESSPKVQPNTPAAVTPANQKPTPADNETAGENPAADSGTSDKPADQNVKSDQALSSTSKPVDAKRKPSFEDLEAAFKVLQHEPAESAEVGPMRELYLEYASRSSDDPVKAKRALGRADQLQVWADIQKKRLELDGARARLKMSATEAVAVQKALESSADYVAVGRVIASPIYDGQRLPKLLRLQDAATGRTIAYLQPDEQYELVNLVGNVVGIVGEKNYDESLRLNLISSKRIDVLTPDQQTTAQGESGK